MSARSVVTVDYDAFAGGFGDPLVAAERLREKIASDHLDERFSHKVLSRMRVRNATNDLPAEAKSVQPTSRGGTSKSSSATDTDDAQRVDDFGSKFSLSKNAKLFWRLRKPCGYQHVESYNHWITEMAEMTLSSWRLRISKDGHTVGYISFEGLRIMSPMHTTGSRVLPQECRERGESYSASWYIDLVYQNLDGETIAAKRTVPIGKIPLMLKSSPCALSEILHDRKALRQRGEDPDDPYGFYIIDGAEKVILPQEHMVTGRIYVMNVNKLPTCRLTANTIKGTVLMELSLMEKSMGKSNIQIRLHSMRRSTDDTPFRTINVLMVYRFFGLSDRDTVRRHIMRFVPHEWIPKCIVKLVPSELDVDSFIVKIPMWITDPITGLTRIEEVESVDGYFKSIAETLYSSQDADSVKAEMDKVFKTDLFPHLEEMPDIEGETLEDRDARITSMKLDMLSLCIAEFIVHLAGFVPLVIRDMWGNKRIETGPRLMDALLRTTWRKTIQTAQGVLLQQHISLKPEAALDKAAASISNLGLITKTFDDSFRQGKWGMKGTKLKLNITQPLQRDSQNAAHSHVNTTDVPIQKRDRQVKLRQAQGSQYGMICFARTTEGANCGILKELSLACRIAFWRPDDDIISYILNNNKVRTFEQRGETHRDLCLINSKFLGWCNGRELLAETKEFRKNHHMIHSDVTLVYEKSKVNSGPASEGGRFYYDSGPSRLYRPLLIVDKETQTLVIDKLGKRDATESELINAGALEFISAWEQEFIKLATCQQDLITRKASIKRAREELERLKLEQAYLDSPLTIASKKEKQDNKEALRAAEIEYENLSNSTPYTHCEIDPQGILSVSIACSPFPEFNQAPRTTYQGNMARQSVGNYHTEHINRMDGKTKVLVNSQPALCSTECSNLLQLDERGTGQNIKGAFLCLPDTEEDAFVINKRSADMGMFRHTKYVTYRDKAETSTDFAQVFKRPPDNLIGKYQSDLDRYSAITDNGLPRKGAYLGYRSCVIGKTETKDGKEKNVSHNVKIGDDGVVTRVIVVGTDTVCVKLRITRPPRLGDKFSARCAQKGTSGDIRNEDELPWSELTGVAPDIFINPSQIPSRMTVSYLYEMQSSKAAAFKGERVNCTAFHNYDMDHHREILKDKDLDEYGYEWFVSPITGERLKAMVFSGIVHFQSSKHQGVDKMQARGEGARRSFDNQPVKGKEKGGGIRFGEMERDAVISYGATNLLLERLRDTSDLYLVVVCRACGNYAIEDFSTKPSDPEYVCPLCSNRRQPMNANISPDKSLFGRLPLPYAIKYMQQLLASTGINLGYNIADAGKGYLEERLEEEPDIADDIDRYDDEARRDFEAAQEGKAEDQDEFAI